MQSKMGQSYQRAPKKTTLHMTLALYQTSINNLTATGSDKPCRINLKGDIMLKQSLCLCQNTMDTTGGVTNTVFPMTEKRLIEKEIYLDALLFSARYKKIGRYESIMDFLFCEVFPIPWRKVCFQYYEDRKRQLCDIKGFKADYYDNLLCNLVLDMCKLAQDSKKDVSWTMLCKNVYDIMELHNKGR